jgi:tight adherence protein B
VSGSAALGGLLGAVTGLGVFLVICGLRGTAPRQDSRRWQSFLAAARRQATLPRVTATLAVVVVVATVTRWPVGTLLAGLAAWFLPPVLGPDREHARAVEKIEAIASWTEQLRDTLAAAAGLEQAILATAPIAPAAVRGHVAGLAARIRQG